MPEASTNWLNVIQFFISPLILTLAVFWTYFAGKKLKERGAKLSPLLWAFIVWLILPIAFPLFLLLRHIKWKKEAVEPQIPHKFNQRRRILVIIVFFVAYIFNLVVLAETMPPASKFVEVKKIEEIEAPEEISEEKIQLNIDQIKNAEIYSDVFKEKVQLIDGQYERSYPEGASKLYVVISDDKIVFGDLDNDGLGDIAVIAYWSGGGSGNWRELTILKNEIGHPLFITSKDLGDRTIINSLTIESGVITIDMIIHGPSDPMCCPTLKKVAKYKLIGTELVEIIDETAD